MSLFTATLLPGLFLIILGALLLVNNPAVISIFKGMPRSKVAAFLFFGAGAGWFLWVLLHLGEADFGEFRNYLFMGFAAVSLLAFYYVPDFLAVRGLAVLMLLAGHPLLHAAFGEYDVPARLFMVTAVYLGISTAIILGVMPYRLRDFFQWLFASRARPRAIGTGLLAYGVILTVVAATY